MTSLLTARLNSKADRVKRRNRKMVEEGMTMRPILVSSGF